MWIELKKRKKMHNAINKTYLLVLVSILSTLATISIAAYLPSMPQMAEHFNVGIKEIEFSLSIFMIGLTLGLLFAGPISDRKGRRYTTLVALLAFSVFSFLIVFASSLYELYIYRFFEAFFSGFLVVNASAILRDMFKGKDAKKFFSLFATLRGIIPIISPSLGALILFFYSWKAIFIFLGIYSLILAFFIFKDLKETFTYVVTNVFESYKSILFNKNAIFLIMILSLGFSSSFIIVSKSSYIYMEYFYVNAEIFSLFYALNFFAMMIFSSINIKLIKRYSPFLLIKLAVMLQILFSLVFVLFIENMSIYYASLLIALYVGMNGFIFGNSTASILEYFPSNAGVASSVIGVFQFFMASLISFIIVLFSKDDLFILSLGMFFIPSISFLFLVKIKL